MNVPLRTGIVLLFLIAIAGAAPMAVAGEVGETAAPTLNETDPADAEYPITVTDATGTEVRLEERPERVTTTNPSAAQVMWELEAQDQVVGLTEFAHYLDGADTPESVSATEQGVSIERVVGTNPDLVLAPNATSTETVEALREAGLTVYHFSAATDFDDVADKTLTIGQLTGNEAAAVETNRWVAANVEVIERSTADAESPRLLYPLLGGFAVGDETFIHEIIVTSGADNVAAEEFSGYEVLSDETVLELDPDVLLVTDQTEGQIMNSEPYSLTAAGQANQSVMLEVNYINQAAPRSVVYSTRNLTAQLHPDRYNESDFVSRQAIADGEYTLEDDDESSETEPASSDDEGETDVSAPGFGVVVTVVAVIGGGLIARHAN